MSIRETTRTWLAVTLLLTLSPGPAFSQAQASALANETAVGSGAAPDQSSVVLRRVLADPEVNSYYWTPSPDGSSVSYVDWAHGNLVIRDLATDEIRRVTDKGGWNESTEFAETSAWSPDGRRIAYAYCCSPGYGLRISNVDGSDTQVLSTYMGYVIVLDWSPDGEHILAGIYPGGENGYLALISVQDGTERRFDVPFDLVRPIEFSPDGRYVAYAAPADVEGHRNAGPASQAERDIYVLSVATGDLAKLVEAPGSDLFMGWGSEGDRIYFYSDRSGSPSIWTAAVSDGRPVGPPELLRRDVEGLEPNGTGGGGFFYTVTVETPQTHTMALDVESGRVLAAPTPERGPSDGQTGSADWSPDGRYLAYVHTPPSVGRSAPSNLVIRSASGNNLRTLPFPFSANMLSWLKWDADSKSVLLLEQGQGTIRIHLETGESESIPGPSQSRAALSPDGSKIYAANPPSDPGDQPAAQLAEQQGIYAYDVEGAKVELILELGPVAERGKPFGFAEGQQYLADMSVSQDGETLALGFGGGIVLAPASGGEPELLYRSEPLLLRARSGLPWTPDGKYILFTMGSFDLLTQELWAVSVDSGEARRLLTFDNLSHVRLHPDGKRLAFSGGTTKAELWVMEPEHGEH